jgi:hypothetical protein
VSTNPSNHPDIYRSLILGGAGVETPGTVKLSGHERTHKWDRQRPKGTAGEFTVNQGPNNGGFTATFFLADLEDVTRWDECAKLIASTVDGPKPVALGVYHPDLVRQRITDVVCESLGGLQHDSKGGATVVVKFLEYRPPKPKPAAKPTARTGTTTVERPDPNASAKRELAELLAQAKAP